MPLRYDPNYIKAIRRRLTRGLPMREYTHAGLEPMHKHLMPHDPGEKKEAAPSNPRRELAEDLQEQYAVRGPQALNKILPEKLVEELHSILRRESPKQTMAGIGGGAVGGLLGGAGGALTTLMTHGKNHALLGGLLGVAPGMLGGYVTGRNLQQRNELAELLKSRLGNG